MSTIEKLQDIFRDVFDDDTLSITNDTSAKDIDEWDSLTHMELIAEVEKTFDIKLTTAQIKDAQNVGDLVNAIDNQVSA